MLHPTSSLRSLRRAGRPTLFPPLRCGSLSSICRSSSTVSAATATRTVRGANPNTSTSSGRVYTTGWCRLGTQRQKGAAVSAAVAVALIAGMASKDREDIMTKAEQGPVPGGPSFGGDDDLENFQRYPSSNRVYHAQKIARQNTSRERRRYYQYMIVGAGTTAKAAIEAILAVDPDADISLLTNEVALPGGDVHRKDHPLPQDLLEAYNEWRRHVSARLENEPQVFSSVPMTLMLGTDRVRIDSQRRLLILDDGTEVFFDKCLLATAGKPRQFYVLDSDKSAYQLRGRINTLGSLSDFESLEVIDSDLGCEDVTVVGGGFLGTEVALAMAQRGMKVWQVYAEPAPLCRQLPLYLAEYVKKKLERYGVQPKAGRLVTDVRGGDDGPDLDVEKINLSMMGASKENIITDYLVMASTHVDPVVDVARESGLEIDPMNGGVVVNGQLEAVSGIYAAGACASYYDQALGRRRADILEHGVRSGWLAGYNMAVTSLAARQDGGERERRWREHMESTSPYDSDTSGTPAGARPHKGSSSAGVGRSGSREGGLTAQHPSAGKGLRYPSMYRHQPAFRSRLEPLDITVDGVGEIDSRTRTVGVWVEGADGGDGGAPGSQRASPLLNGGQQKAILPGMPRQFDRGIIYYLYGSQIIGIVLWNASDLVDKARDVITNQPAVSSTEQLKTLIALAPDDWLSLVETSTVAPPLKRRRARQ